MKSLWVALLLFLSISLASSQDLRINHMQVIGTHNSYHLRPEEPLFSQIEMFRPEVAASWDYSHAPLDQQMENGVRSFEIDTYIDPEGFRVEHLPEYDDNSTCDTFVECLEIMKRWSDANPWHVPMIVLVQVKDEPIDEIDEEVIRASAEALDQMDAELMSVFPEEKLIRPDDVRGDHAILRDAILQSGWPTINDSRGTFLFALHEDTRILDLYADGRPSLQGRPMFVTSSEERDDASILVVNDPFNEDIQRLAEQGFIIRTRADAGITDAAEGQTDRRDRAFQSAAHVISTDFPMGTPHPESGYVVEFEEGIAVRCNPLIAPEGCSPETLETPQG